MELKNHIKVSKTPFALEEMDENLLRSGVFREFVSSNTQLDVLTKSIIVQFELENMCSNTEWLLSLGDSQAKVTAYVFSGDTLVQKVNAGIEIPFYSRNIPLSSGDYIHLKIRNGEKLNLFIVYDVREHFSKNFIDYSFLNLKLLNKDNHIAYIYWSKTINAFFYGAILIMLLYNLFLTISLHSRVYLAYSAFLAAFFAYNLFSNGFMLENVLYANPVLERKFRVVIVPLMMIAYIVFSKVYLNTKKNNKIFDSILNVCLILSVLSLTPIVANEWWIARTVILTMVVVVSTVILIASIFNVSRGHVESFYFLFANSILMVSGIVTVFYLSALIPHNYNTKYLEFFPQMASVVQLSLFSLALADRIKQAEKNMLEQRLSIEHDKKMLIEEKNKELELKVVERTKELIEQKRKIQEYNESLEAKVRERTKKLQKAYRDLLNVNNELDSFVYRAAHDIRGPVSTILGLCNIALLENDFKKCQEYLLILDKHSKNTLITLNRILSVNEIKNNPIRLTIFTFTKLKESLMGTLINNEDHSKVDIRFEIPAEEQVTSDFYLMQLVVQNLIDNSIRFRSTDAHVKPYCVVSIQLQEKALVFRVSDNGAGIDPSQQDKIFDMFYRGSESSSGSGLGLYIASVAASRLQGTIKLVQSEPGNTVFEFVMPRVSDKSTPTALVNDLLQTPVN